jgi:hypothetical protein
LRNRLESLIKEARSLNSTARGRTGGDEGAFSHEAWGCIQAIIAAKDEQTEEKNDAKDQKAAFQRRREEQVKAAMGKVPSNEEPKRLALGAINGQDRDQQSIESSRNTNARRRSSGSSEFALFLELMERQAAVDREARERAEARAREHEMFLLRLFAGMQSTTATTASLLRSSDMPSTMNTPSEPHVQE